MQKHCLQSFATLLCCISSPLSSFVQTVSVIRDHLNWGGALNYTQFGVSIAPTVGALFVLYYRKYICEMFCQSLLWILIQWGVFFISVGNCLFLVILTNWHTEAGLKETEHSFYVFGGQLGVPQPQKHPENGASNFTGSTLYPQLVPWDQYRVK